MLTERKVKFCLTFRNWEWNLIEYKQVTKFLMGRIKTRIKSLKEKLHTNVIVAKNKVSMTRNDGDIKVMYSNMDSSLPQNRKRKKLMFVELI